MATWKKVIVSGSNADLAQITSSVGIDTLSTRTDQHIAITGSATSTASFGAYIGDGSQLTGVGMDIQRVYYVSPSGDDSTGVVGSLNYPFQTISGSVVQAKADAAAGSYHVSSSVINIMPGHYFEQDLQMDGGTYYFHPGAILSPPVQANADKKPMFSGSSATNNLKILGQGEFRLQSATDNSNTGQNSPLITANGADTNVHFEFDQVTIENATWLEIENNATVNVIGNKVSSTKTLGSHFIARSNGSNLNIEVNEVFLSGSDFLEYRGNGDITAKFNNVEQHKGSGFIGYLPGAGAQIEAWWNRWTLKDAAETIFSAGNNSTPATPHFARLHGDVFLETDGDQVQPNTSVSAGSVIGRFDSRGFGQFAPRNLVFSHDGHVYSKQPGTPYYLHGDGSINTSTFHIDADIDHSGSNEAIYIGGGNVKINGSIDIESGHGINIATTTADLVDIGELKITANSNTSTPLAITGSVGSAGKPRISGILSSNRALGANINLTGSGIFTNDTDAAQIVNASIKSSHDGGSTFTALSANPYTASFGRFEGFSASFAHMTVSGDSLLEDIVTTGTTKLGNDMSDKVEVTGSLNVTGSSFFQGSSIFSGSSAEVTIDPYSSDNIITIKNTVDSSTDKIVFLKSDNTEMANLANRGSRSELVLKNNGSDSIKISNFNNSFHEPNFAIGSTSEDTNNTLSVTGNANITNGLTVSGSTALNVTGSLNLTGSFTGTAPFIDGYKFNFGQTTKNIHFQGGTLLLNDHGSSSTALQMRSSTSNRLLLELNNSNEGGELSIRTTNNASSISLGGVNGSYHNPNLHLGATSTQSDAKLKVTGNILATTGITGSYLTADRIPFTNASKGLTDSSNLVYDDDGGLNVGGKLTLTGDLLVSHNLTVQGTASFQHTEDLDVADRFIRMASGSTSTGDGGIAVQQTGPTDTEGFGYDSTEGRWGVTSSFDASQNALAPVAFMPVAINGTENVPTSNQVANEARYKKAGNIYIDTDATMEEGGVWIYV